METNDDLDKRIGVDPATKARIAELAKGYNHFRELVQRFSYEGKPSWHQLYTAARNVGFTLDEFGRMNNADLYKVLKAKAEALDAPLRRGSRNAPASERLRKMTRSKGGRPFGVLVNSEMLRAQQWSGEKQLAFAERCGISEDTLQRGLGGEIWSLRTVRKVARRLKIKAKELEKR